MSMPTPGPQQPQYPQQPQPPYGYAPQPQPPKKKRKTWLWVIAIIGGLIVIGGIMNAGKQPGTTSAGSSTSTEQAAPQPPAAKEPAAPAKRTVVYEVTGTGQANNITYTTDGMTSTEQVGQVQLPWSKTLELEPGKAFQMVTIVAQAGQNTPEISAKITVDGKVIKEGKSSGLYAVLTVSENIGSLK